MRIRRFSEARGIFQEEFSLEPQIYCFGGPGGGDGGGGGSSHPGRPGGESGERGNRSDRGDGNDRDDRGGGDDDKDPMGMADLAAAAEAATGGRTDTAAAEAAIGAMDRDGRDDDDSGPSLIDSYLEGPMLADISTPMTGGAFVDPTTGYGVMSDVPGAAAQAAMDYTNAIATGQRGSGNMAMTTGDLDTGTGGARFAGVGFDDPLGYYDEGDTDITAIDPSFDLEFGDTAPSIAAPEIAPPSVASDVTVGRQQAIAPPPSIRGQVTSVDPQAIEDVQARNAISGVTGMGQPTTVGEGLVDSLFSDLAETPEVKRMPTSSLVLTQVCQNLSTCLVWIYRQVLVSLKESLTHCLTQNLR